MTASDLCRCGHARVRHSSEHAPPNGGHCLEGGCLCGIFQTDSDGQEKVLLRFVGLQNSDRIMPLAFFGSWPLPERFAVVGDGMDAVFSHKAEMIAKAEREGIPIYVKTSESKLSSTEAAEMSHVMRGAEYRKESEVGT